RTTDGSDHPWCRGAPVWAPFSLRPQKAKREEAFSGSLPFGWCADWGLSQALTTLFQQLPHDLLAGLHGLALALHRGLLEVLPFPQLGQDSRFLDFALETAQGVLKALLLAHMHNGH